MDARLLLEPDSDQDFLRETTAKYLTNTTPVSVLRELRDDPVGFDADYWQQGAALGWTSLLVGEEFGGGSISGNGLVDLTLLAYEFGRNAAPGPLIPTNIVAGALSANGSHVEVIAGLVSGEVIAGWCDAEGPPNDNIGAIATEIREDGDGFIIDGAKRPVESAAHSSHLLVTGRTGDGYSQVLVPTTSEGITIAPMQGVDLTRRFSVVGFDGVHVDADALVGRAGHGSKAIEKQRLQATVICNAEAVGAMKTAFDMTVEWAFDRYSFGRPLASYQAIKHRFADMATWLEASHAIAKESAEAVATGAADAAKLVSAAKAYIGEFGSELMQECVQFHGGIGVTYEHDIHLYLRRHTLDRAMFGTPAQHRRRVAQCLTDEEENP